MSAYGRSSCPSLEQLYAAFEGTLPPLEQRQVRHHLEGCARCAQAIDEARELRAMEAEVLSAAHPPQGEHPSGSWAERLLALRGPRAHAGEPGPAPVLAGVAVQRMLARGGCADVWLARAEAGHVVVKVVRTEVSAHELEALRLYKQLADSPELGLFPIHHIARCEATGRLCYTMPPADPLSARTLDASEYDAASLEAWLERHGTLSLTGTLELAHALLDSLAGLHAKGLVHRDVKPSNVLRFHGRWCLGDTGLLVREGTVAAELCIGTPTFLPPERRNDLHSADLYALGKTLYLARNGSLERFPAPTAEQLRDEREGHLTLYRALARACHSEPPERFASAEAMRRALAPRGRTTRRALVASLALVVLSGLAWRRLAKPSPVAARTPGLEETETEVGALELVFRNPGTTGSTFLRPGAELHAGVEFRLQVAAPGPPHVVLVMAQYVDGARSVKAVVPRNDPLDPDHLHFRPPDDARGQPTSYRAVHPTPLLFVLVGSTRRLDALEVESEVERALDGLEGWPMRRGESRRPTFDAPLRFHGTRVGPMAAAETFRGGPDQPLGGALGPVEVVQLVTRLDGVFERFDGLATEVLP